MSFFVLDALTSERLSTCVTLYASHCLHYSNLLTDRPCLNLMFSLDLG